MNCMMPNMQSMQPMQSMQSMQPMQSAMVPMCMPGMQMATVLHQVQSQVPHKFECFVSTHRTCKPHLRQLRCRFPDALGDCALSSHIEIGC